VSRHKAQKGLELEPGTTTEILRRALQTPFLSAQQSHIDKLEFIRFLVFLHKQALEAVSELIGGPPKFRSIRRHRGMHSDRLMQ
jgi:hypothetical protein